jgi:hypothetical protein
VPRRLACFATLAALVLCHTVQGQTALDSLLERRVPTCTEVDQNAIALVTRTIGEGLLDSAASITRSWQQKCPDSETAFRTMMLIRLVEDSAIADRLDGNALRMFWFYGMLAEAAATGTYQPVPPAIQYVNFTQQWAKELLNKYAPGTVEYDVCKTYASEHDHLFQRLQAPDGAYPALRKRYNDEVARYASIGEIHYALITGIWLPTGDLEPLGAKPLFGFQLGGKSKKLSYDITMAFAAGKAAEPYLSRRNKDLQPERTQHFFGGHIGVDFGWDLWSHKANELQVNAGIGADGFDSFRTDAGEKNRSGTVFVLDLSPGITYRRYLTSWSYLGLQVHYHYVDYARSGIVDMRGDPITVRLIYGGLMNMTKRLGMRGLRYNYRQ